jgi:uncharacterized membrane protein
MSMPDPRGPARLESYLARLEAALSTTPTVERREILLETRSHVLERTRRGQPQRVEDVLAQLGAPEAYARQFMPELDTPTTPHANALSGIARLASGGSTALPALFVVAMSYAVAVLALLMAAWELLEPDKVGLWLGTAGGERRILLGSYSRGPHMREVLGDGLVPLALVLAVTVHIAMSALLRRLVRDDARCI